MTTARLIQGADLAGGGVADLLVVGDTIAANPGAFGTVSYTHLTLPTKRIV